MLIFGGPSNLRGQQRASIGRQTASSTASKEGLVPMKRSEFVRLGRIIFSIETLQKRTDDRAARDRLGVAKDELLRLHSEAGLVLK
jgi:hypothetical protein